MSNECTVISRLGCVLIIIASASLITGVLSFDICPSGRNPAAFVNTALRSLSMRDKGQSMIDDCLLQFDDTRRSFLLWGASATVSVGIDSDAAAIESEDSAELSSPSSASSASANEINPQIPYSSVRRYRVAKLPNGLRALLVSDKKAIRGSAALSVGGAGQFADPENLPGCAHLMEHMVLSVNAGNNFRRARDFEDWLSDRDGFSNGFTAYDSVCFHFSCEETAFPEALNRFAGLFRQESVEAICREEFTLRREVRRVNSELNFEYPPTQSFYLVKDFVNPEHPYSRFSSGSLDTLEKIPKEAGMDVGSRLVEFFRRHYQPSEAVLVVIGSQDVFTLERWVAAFGSTLSTTPLSTTGVGESRRTYPGAFLQGNRPKQMFLYAQSSDVDREKLTLEWSLDLDYRDMMQSGKQSVTATQIGFVVAQILGRRGPGSLYFFLLRRGWIPRGSTGVPHIMLPVDVSGFQVIKLEINLTLEGFINRSAVVAAVYDTIDAALRGDRFAISRQLVAQYASVAKLHGYLLSPRPPDAIELALDSLRYGFDPTYGVASGNWYRFPSTDDPVGISTLQQAVSETLMFMSDPGNAVIVVTVGNKAITKSRAGIFDEPIPPFSSSRWVFEPVTGARFCFTDMLGLTGRVEELVLTRLVDEDELLRPVLNPLIPVPLRPPRAVTKSINMAAAMDEITFPLRSDSLPDPAWTILELSPGRFVDSLPRIPPERTCRCSFVVQLLSSRPARANVRQAARAELWKESFEQAVVDLAELGSPGGLAYDLSFNKYGLRIAFIGLSQNLPSYARRFTRRLVDHHFKLLQGSETLPSSVKVAALAAAKRARGLSGQRRGPIVSNLRGATAYEVATEGIAFLRSCKGAVCFAEGDLLRSEVKDLVDYLQGTFVSSTNSGNLKPPAQPFIQDLLYKPIWKPRPPSTCSIPGAQLIADACGRIPR